MQIELTSIGLRWQRALGAVVLLALLGFCALAVRNFRAQAWLYSGDVRGVEESAAIEPRNSDVWYVLGHTKLLVLQDAEGALTDLRRSIALNPHDARYWLDVSAAERLLGNTIEEHQAMARATAADPTTPDVALQAARLALADGDTLTALHRFRTVAQFDPDKAVSVLELCWRQTKDIELLVENAVPATSDGYSAMLAVLLEQSQFDAIMPLWEAAQRNHVAIPSGAAAVAVNSLLLNHHSDAAAHIWRGIAGQDPDYREYLSSTNNLIVNPGFESELINVGFDWHVAAADGVRFDVDTDAHSENRSLRIEFATSAPADPGIAQYVPVTPGRRYRVGFFAKTDDLASVSKPQLLIEDADTGAQLDHGLAIVNYSFWKEYADTFKAPPQTRLLRIHLVRDPAAPLISGRLWLDDFSLAEVQAR